MSATDSPDTPNVEKLIRDNPGIDADQFRRAQELLEDLGREGVDGPSYGIVSPYERRPLSKPDSVRPTMIR